jgi:hypothetical protein
MSFKTMDKQDALNLIEELHEFNSINNFMEDDEVLKALGYVRRLIAKPDVPAIHAPILVTQLEALSANFGILATYYTTLEKNPQRKNMYYTLRDKIKDLADAVKYLSR